MSRKNEMSAPDMSSVTEANAALASRLSLSTPPTPAHTPSTEPVHTQHAAGTRPDPDGMRRLSIYVSAAAAEALEAAADQVRAHLGDDTPRHVALSALLQAGADRADDVGRHLAQQRAAELRRRLAELE